MDDMDGVELSARFGLPPNSFSYCGTPVFRRAFAAYMKEKSPANARALEAALSMLRVHGRIIACGGISGYNEEKPRPGPSNLFNITTKRLTMKGLIVRDWLDRQGEFEKEVGGYLQSGKLKNKETVVEGLDQAESAFIGLFTGNNIGKMVVKLP